MKLNKKVVESMTVTSAMLVMTTITAFGGSTEDSTGGKTEHIALNKNGTAGIISELHDAETNLLNENAIMTASIERLPKDVVANSGADVSFNADPSDGTAGPGALAAEVAIQSLQSEEPAAAVLPSEPTETTELIADAEIPAPAEAALSQDLPEEALEQPAAEVVAEPSPEEAEWANRVMANVEEDMNIRTAPDETSELAGKFYRGDVAEVVAIDGEWTQIASGNVSGYVKNDYLVYGMEANALANEVCTVYATVNTDGLRLRNEPSEESEIITTANTGDKLKVDIDTDAVDGWVAVHTSDDTAYVSAEYVGVALNLGTPLNSEEVAAKEAKEAEEKAAEASKKPAVSAGADEVTLLGALIQCEAGSGSYEGMVAVGAVVMNRVRSGAYPGSISGVIYQSGQFPPALNGSVANVAAGGVRSACLQAAREAINGTDNTNGALSFRSAASGYAGTVIGANVFF